MGEVRQDILNIPEGVKIPPRPPFDKGKVGKNDLSLFPVIPAKAGIQCFQKLSNFLDPGFHRGDEPNQIRENPKDIL